MKMRRSVLVSVIGIGIIAVVVCFALTAEFRSMRRAFDRIQPGMTLPEVEAIVGRPPEQKLPTAEDLRCYWMNGEGELAIVILHGKLVSKRFEPTTWQDRIKQFFQWE